MTVTRRTVLALAAATLPATWLNPAWAADTTITASLWDKGPDSMAMMGITLSAASAPAGKITFTATNDSKDTIHEMVLAPVSDPNTPMPYDEATMKVDEDAAGHLGEVAELEPGASGSLTLEMQPGTYILYCNIPGHYAMGMWTLFTVTG